MDREQPDPSHPLKSQLESQLAAWRAHLQKSPAIAGTDVEELEDHLRERIDSLVASGLSEDEAFLVAVKRMGAIDALTREFARQHSERLWKQLVLPGGEKGGGADAQTIHGALRMWVALALAVAAAVTVKIPALFGISMFPDSRLFYPLHASFFTLPFLVAYFAWDRPLATGRRWWLAGAFAVAALVVNVLPFSSSAAGLAVPETKTLLIPHLPLALWFLVGVAYVGGRWRGNEGRMDFIRFTGELFVYFVLIVLGGFVLIGLTFALFRSLGLDVGPLVHEWIVPCGAAGATVVATWLVEAKQSVIENIAPVLARIFIPLFALVLFAFVLTMVATGRGLDVGREILIAVDLLLAVVFGLLLYSISARDPLDPPSAFDWLQLTLVCTALVVDVLALWAIGSRISSFGFSPNRTAGLGMNVVLLVNLAGSAIRYARFLRGTGGVSGLWDWQMSYLYVLAAWAAVVAFLFPVLFDFA